MKRDNKCSQKCQYFKFDILVHYIFKNFNKYFVNIKFSKIPELNIRIRMDISKLNK